MIQDHREDFLRKKTEKKIRERWKTIKTVKAH